MLIIDNNIDIKPKIEYNEWLNKELKLLQDKCKNFKKERDKNFTLTNRLYVSENPLFLGEYHQVFKNTTLMTDFGYTEGYKKTSSIKKAGNKSHFF